MKPQYFASTLFVATLLLTSCGHHQKKKSPEAGMPVTQSISAKGVEHLISNWPEASKKAANSMIKKYGLPHDYTDMSLIWHESGPFKSIMVYREEVPHNFPLPHTDVLQQWVNYKVPLSKVDDLWQFDGSVMFDRTKGEMSARCDKEEMNVLALNLADQVIKGKMSAEQARKEYANSVSISLAGHLNDYTDGLNFSPMLDTADPDKVVKVRPIENMQAQEAKPLNERSRAERVDEALE